MKRNIQKQGWLIFFLLFFGILWLFFEPGIYPDSNSYLVMQEGREPGYPLFLTGVRLFFGKSGYLKAVTFFQNLLAALSCYFFVVSIGKIFKAGLFFQAGIAGCALIPHVLTPLASSSGMILGNAILTEGLAFPFYTVYGVCLVKGLLEQEKKVRNYLWAAGIALFLSLIRNQMLVTLAVWIVVVLFEICRNRQWKYGAGVFLVLFAVFFVRQSVNEIYNRTLFLGYTGADTGSYNVLTTLLYLSDKEDASFLTDEIQKNLFLTMQEQMTAGKMTSAYAPEGILGRAYHYEEYYDVIGFTVQQPCLFDYVKENGAQEEAALNQVLSLAAQMNKELGPHLYGAYISNYLAAAVSGLTRSVAGSGMLMGAYSVFIYFLAGILVIYLYKKKKENEAGLFMLLSFLMICANAFATALVIMCLSRYMIYNTAFFYAAGLMQIKTLSEFFRAKRTGLPSDFSGN